MLLDEYLRAATEVVVTKPVTGGTTVQGTQTRNAHDDCMPDEGEVPLPMTCERAFLAVDVLQDLIMECALSVLYVIHLNAVEHVVVHLRSKSQM